MSVLTSTMMTVIFLTDHETYSTLPTALDGVLSQAGAQVIMLTRYSHEQEQKTWVIKHQYDELEKYCAKIERHSQGARMLGSIWSMVGTEESSP